MKKIYENPEMNVETFSVEDVITDNAGGDNELSGRV